MLVSIKSTFLSLSISLFLCLKGQLWWANKWEKGCDIKPFFFFVEQWGIEKNGNDSIIIIIYFNCLLSHAPNNSSTIFLSVTRSLLSISQIFVYVLYYAMPRVLFSTLPFYHPFSWVTSVDFISDYVSKRQQSRAMRCGDGK